MSPTVLELLKISIPAVVVFATTWVVINAFLTKEYKVRQIEGKIQNMRQSLPIRLQAYERLALYLERIAFNNLLYRVRESDMNVREFQLALLSTIRAEFEHNITQQIYVSDEVWGMTKAVKEEATSVINRIGSVLPPDAPSKELSRRVFAFLIETEHEMMTTKAMEAIKKEVSELY